MKNGILYIIVVMSIATKGHAASRKLKVCLTGTTVKTIPHYGKAFYNGALIAKAELEGQFKNLSINIERRFYDRSVKSALLAAQQMVRERCHAIIGFSTGTDLLAVRDLIKFSGVFTLSIYGDRHPTLEEIPHLITMKPAPRLIVKRLFDDLSQKINARKKFLIVTATDRIEMVGYRSAFQKKLDEKGKKFINVSVSEKLNDISEFKKAFRAGKGKFDGLILLTRSNLAAKITDFATANQAPKSMPLILGTSYFGSKSLPAYLGWLENKDIEAYYARQNCMDDSSAEFKIFLQKYRARYKNGQSPMILSAYVYDAVKMIGIAAGRIPKKREINQSSLLRSLSSINFTGLTGISVEKGFAVRHKKSFLMKVDEDGYRCINKNEYL